MKEKRSMNVSTILFMTILFAFVVMPVFGQEGVVAERTAISRIMNENPHIGGIVYQMRRVPGITCMAHSSSMVYATTYDGNMPSRRCSANDCIFYCPMDLPTGVKLIFLGASICDSSSTGSVLVIFRKVSDAGVGTNIKVFDSGDSNTPGCLFSYGAVTTNEIIDNSSNDYYVHIYLSESSATLSFTDVVFIYQYQVMPAPGTATFNDVPTSHLFFQYIEALVQSGITSGCSASPLLYCPDSYVTRGQMAVFLARALGLGYAY